ncbi:hypothetical protein Y900_019225 [Mycolicibacterium aromaticivorans JS19b1 = JCM 16368]|uniref:Putative host cell surface-exposed lipoprotein Ltp-like HTH region domain-containing protein n=1 Tax=Mycolicibacterium aromaticivorans JS19b1 = JCM 16368 TaxID=1440774 RepID=A0A064CK90_9MYCO|nr:hypothetical protein Y900_019225 [Mycolicibacterium aromaticivorans JS19b1 = JCM 16368]
MAPGTQVEPVPPKKPKVWPWVVIGLVILLFGGCVSMCSSIGSSIDKDKKGSSSSTGSFGRTADVLPPTTSKSMFTPAQDNAIAKAESYLGYTAFSKQGLIKQLEYDKFSAADATFAVEHIEATGGVDWNEQAVKKAKSYLNYTSFSEEGLVNQLEYDGFTSSQAQYGAGKAYGG